MTIKDLAKKYENYIIEQRQFLHGIPELSLNEINTTKKLVEELRKMV